MSAAFALVLLPSLVLAQSGSRKGRPASRASSAVMGIAVVELFTSQGCSSCPPADAVLRQVSEVAAKSRLPVYCLSFHVDYWNRLGWTDPYSSPGFSNRQRSYAAAAGSNRVYTPQMIVGGTEEFVGSNRSKAYAAISASLKQKPASQVALQATELRESAMSVQFRVTGLTRGQVLHVALVQTPPANSVTRGENSGETLSHINVVRDFKTVPLNTDSGTVQLRFPAGVTRSQTSVIAYVQNPNTLRITGASALPSKAFGF
ncbi:MAG: DUF1223 domain-containing protein [Pirellulales bacterium]|nr:DUF1223 domain-containing protein [Pirellulales bacterium]